MELVFADTIREIRTLAGQARFPECEALLSSAMFEHPHDAVPHNLMGLVLEAEGRHEDAMRHFRAAYALDPAYRPSSWNLDCFGSFYRLATPAYCESDCAAAESRKKREGDLTCI